MPFLLVAVVYGGIQAARHGASWRDLAGPALLTAAGLAALLLALWGLGRLTGRLARRGGSDEDGD